MKPRDLHEAEIALLDAVLALFEAPEDVDEAVHSTRKGVKRLRAHLRLTKDAIDPAVYRAEDDGLRSIGRILAPARDAFVLGQTLESLESTGGWGPAAAAIGENHEAVIDELRAGTVDEVSRRFTAVRARWPEHEGLEQTVLIDGLTRTYRRGRAELAVAASDRHAMAFHAWRRRVKYLRYQLEALDAHAGVVATLTELGVTLGFEHDHTVFIDFCDDRIDLLPDRRDRYVLIDRAEQRRDELRATALATKAYAQEPDAFVSSVLG